MTVSSKALLVGLLASSVMIAGCHPKKLSDVVAAGAHISSSDTLDQPITVAAKLDCPADEGDLKLTAAAKDGQTCAYASPTGVVNLSLVEATGDEADALSRFKAEVDAAMPRQAHGENATVSVTTDKAADGRDVSRVDLPFVHVSDDGHRARIRLFGMAIDADSHHHHHHDADDDGDDDKGDSTGADANVAVSGPKGRESVYLLAGDPATPQGYHAVGYVARGDGRGRMVVALFKSRNGDSDNHNHDLDALLDRNARKG
jgi:hypothetical protein